MYHHKEVKTMDFLKTRTCERCKTPTAVEKVRLYPKDSEHNWMVCGDCLDVLKNVAKTRLTNTIEANIPRGVSKAGPTFSTILPSQKRANPAAVQNSAIKKNQFCSRCNYGFNINPARVSTVSCPYCGRMDRVR